MAEYGFTPGKWIETNQSDWRPSNDEIGNVTWTVIQSEETGEDIAIVLEPTPHWKEAVTLDANARLFTASKPLLNALTNLANWAVVTGAADERLPEIQAARAAITLATGKDA